MKRSRGTIGFTLLLLLSACARPVIQTEQTAGIHSSDISSTAPDSTVTPMTLTLARPSALTDEQKHVLYEQGTERPFTSPLLDEHRTGTFVAADTGEPLFRSEAKFDSGTGWPSFFEPVSPMAVVLKEDVRWGISRTEVTTRSGSHLGHVFDDGPEPTGKRYCINGLALRFVPDAEEETASGY